MVDDISCIKSKRLNDQWKQSCRILLGAEIGELDTFAIYLQKFVEPVRIGKSSISGKPVAVSISAIENAKLISSEESTAFLSSLSKQKLDINQIKDFDSLVEAAGEVVSYAGNVMLGKSADSVLSNRLVDSVGAYRSHEVFYSKNVAFSHYVRYSESIFGSSCISKTSFGIKNFETFEDSRLMETVRVYNSSDCYFSANLEQCQNCLFSFNLRNKRNCIGNLDLPPEKFASLKQKLVADIRDTLVQKGNVKTITEIISEV